jgi:predicted adenine nucleotide alpha hydrolase (AANH) superfamily ATPase
MQVPTRFNNMMQVVNSVKSGNPQQMVMNMLQQKAQDGNPVFTNLIGLVQSGNTQEIENIARNMAKERGVDFDKEFNSFKQMFGL